MFVQRGYMSSNKIQFHLELTESQIPFFIGMKIYDADDRTILGHVEEYDKDSCFAIISLTEEGQRILHDNHFTNQAKVGCSISGDYLSKEIENEFNNIFFNSSHNN